MSAQADLTKSKSSPVGIKTNIIYWGTATFNAGVEFRLAPKWTLDLEAGLNPFDGKKDDGSYGKSLKHLRVHPEVRYWFCEAFHKHFLGLHVPYLLYNVSDIMEDPHIRDDREMFIHVDHPVMGDVILNGNPVKLSDTKVGIRFPSPTLGQHNEEILEGLGYTAGEVEGFKEKGVL